MGHQLVAGLPVVWPLQLVEQHEWQIEIERCKGIGREDENLISGFRGTQAHGQVANGASPPFAKHGGGGLGHRMEQSSDATGLVPDGAE